MYMTIAGTTYKVEIDTGSVELLLIENERRALDGSLLVDRITEKWKGSVRFIKMSDNTLISISQAVTLMTALAVVPVAVGGDIGTFSAKFSSIRGEDRRHGGGVYRTVSASFEEV